MIRALYISPSTHLGTLTMERKWVSSLPTCKTPNSHKIPLLLPIMLFFLLNHLSKSAATETEPVLLHSKDKTSLLLFKSQIQDPNRWLNDWESPGSNWTGLTFSNRSGRVTSLNLTRMNLSGLVHPSLCRLLKLETLVLSHNQFYGTIPLCLGRLLYLKTLDLGHNMLRGVVPSSLMRLCRLTEFSLNANHDLNDTVPHWIGNFSMKLEKIDLGFGSFWGEIPQSLYYLKSLKYLDLSHNNLWGNLGDFYQSLVYLNLEANSLSGTLPCLLASAESISVLN